MLKGFIVTAKSEQGFGLVIFDESGASFFGTDAKVLRASAVFFALNCVMPFWIITAELSGFFTRNALSVSMASLLKLCSLRASVKASRRGTLSGQALRA